MARGFLGAIVKVSKAIDAANKRATREAEKQHNQAVRMQKVAEKEYLANLRRQEQEDERRLKYNSLMKKQYQNNEENIPLIIRCLAGQPGKRSNHRLFHIRQDSHNR